MDPVSIIGMASGITALVRVLANSVLSVKNMVRSIRDVDDSIQGFGEELVTYHSSLSMFDYQIRQGTIMSDIPGCDQAKLEALLTNAAKTFSRLDAIFNEIHKRRSTLQNIREYYRMTRYDQEISHLRHRVNIYTLSLHLPLVLSAMRDTQSPSAQANPNLSLLSDRISQLEGNIDNISTDIRTIFASQVTNELGSPPQLESSLRRDSEDLVNIARSFALSASIVASTESRSTVSTVKALDLAAFSDAQAMLNQEHSILPGHETKDDDREHDSLSVIGQPLTAHRRVQVDDWIQKAGTAEPAPPLSDNLSSVSLADTSQTSMALYTPPSTIYTQDEVDIEVELVKRRFKKVKDLMAKGQFTDAIPFLKKILDTANEDHISEYTQRREEIQILLATALTESDRHCQEAEPILREVSESPNANLSDRFSAFHLLARLLLDLHPEDCTEAKSICLKVVKGRATTLGRTDPKTYESIALLASICQASNDSDAEIWREMLPDNYGLPTPVTPYKNQFDKHCCRQTLSHSDSVRGVAFSPDGRVLASASADKMVRLWNSATGKPRGTLEGHSGQVWAVAFSPDGRVLASASFDTTVRLWDSATGKPCGTLKGHSGSVRGVAFSPDGRVLASASEDKTVRLWDSSTGKPRGTLEGHSNWVAGVAFSPDGRVLASASGDKTVRLWDSATGKPRGTLEGHSNRVTGVAFSPDGRVLASASGDKTVRLWDSATKATRHT